MKVNLTEHEYRLLCELADHYKTAPAFLAHRWLMARVQLEYHLLLKARDGMGSRDGEDTLPHPEIPSSPEP